MMKDFELLRHRMVERQLERRDIDDEAVLETMRKIPRHLFVPANRRRDAYEDYPLYIGNGQTISQPYIVALMTQHLQVEQHHSVLEIGTGSGYQCAILADMAFKVTSIERIPELADRAKELFEELKIKNVDVIIGDGTLGLESNSPYDRIMVTAGAPEIPKSLIHQLAGDGRMVIPVGSESVQDLNVVIKTDDQIRIETEGGCRFVKLVGEEGWLG